MSNKYRAEQYISISASESGTEIELQMVVDFTGHPGSTAYWGNTPEGPTAEIDNIEFFLMKKGKPKSDAAQLPDWLVESLTSGQDFIDWMLLEARQQRQAALEDQADHRRDHSDGNQEGIGNETTENIAAIR